MSSRAGIFFLLVTSVVWGTVGVAQKLAAVSAEPAEIGATRLVVGALALVVVAVGMGRRWRLVRALAGPWWGWTLAAGAATAAYQAAFFSAVDRTGVALAAVVTLGSAPVLCGLLARRLLGERMPRSWSAATACAIAGCALLLQPSGSSGPSAAGVMLALVAGGCYGVYTICLKHLLDRLDDTMSVLAATLSIGAVLSLPAFVTGVPALSEPEGLLLAAWLGLVATAGAYLLFARGLARVPATTAGTLSLAEPLTAAVLGVVVLAERPTLPSVAGALVLSFGLVVTAVRRERTAQPAGTRAPAASMSLSGQRPWRCSSSVRAEQAIEPLRFASPMAG